MPQISRLLDHALAHEVAVIDDKLLLARVTLGRLGAVLQAGQTAIAAVRVQVYNDALAQANQALDNVKAAVTGGTHPRAIELVAEIPVLEMWIDDALAQGIPFNAALAAEDAPGALALMPDLQAALADAQTATQLLAGVVDAGKVSGLRLEDTAAAMTIDDPLPLSLRLARGPALPAVFARNTELVRTRTRSSAEIEANTRRAFAAAAAALVVVATRAYRPQLVGMRLS